MYTYPYYLFIKQVEFKMTAVLIIFRYPRRRGFLGFFSMALFRVVLWKNKSINFFKLMGCGKNGTFSAVPDARQWSLFYTLNAKPEDVAKQNTSAKHLLQHLSGIIYRYVHYSGAEVFAIILKPLEGYGLWDKKVLFNKTGTSDNMRPVAVLTRATINLKSISSFWKNVQRVSDQMRKSEGFIFSLGMGEVPWIKQATFSVWHSKESLKDFAYRQQPHLEVIHKTRVEKWYKEELFYRFSLISVFGTIKGNNPLQSVL